MTQARRRCWGRSLAPASCAVCHLSALAEVERLAVVLDVYVHGVTFGVAPFQQGHRQRVADGALDDTAKRAGAERPVVTMVTEPHLGGVGHLEVHPPALQALGEAEQ